jgi:hypothetical protein
MKRTLAVFLCAATAALSLAIIKALVVSGLNTLPPLRVLAFAASMFGLLAALLDWALMRQLRPSAMTTPERTVRGPQPAATMPPPVPQSDSIIARARLRPIAFRENCPPSPGLSFYGGAPVGPASLAWPRNKSDDVPLSFIMQWDCTALASQDVTRLLPRDGALYLFADLGWSDFRFVHAPGPIKDWRALPVPPELPPVYGKGGVHHVPYCSSLIAPERQDVPVLLPRWSFTPLAFSFPATPDTEPLFWNEGEAVAEALLRLEHPEGVQPATHLRKRQSLFARPFPAFPHDYAAIRIVVAKVLEQLRHPAKRLLRDASEEQSEATFQQWRDEASKHYAAATAHHPAERVDRSMSDELWQWMEGLKPVLQPGWDRVVEECVNVSLGLGSETDALPSHIVAVCAEQHRLALAYLHEEYPDRRKPEALTAWEKRKAEGTLKEVRTMHAPCPNHMFGPPSYVQSYVEEHLEETVLLLELSTRQPIGHEFGEGVLQFMIRPADLREGRFDKAMLIASAY